MKQLARLGRRLETENVRQAWQSGGAFGVRRAEIVARDDTISGFFFFYGRVAGFKVASQNAVEREREKKKRHFSERPPSFNFDKSSLRGLKLNCAAAGASSEALILAPPLSTQTALVKQSLKQVFLEITAPVK